MRRYHRDGWLLEMSGPHADGHYWAWISDADRCVRGFAQGITERETLQRVRVESNGADPFADVTPADLT